MLFWAFLFIMGLLVPLTMIFFGSRFEKRPPKEIKDVHEKSSNVEIRPRIHRKALEALRMAWLTGLRSRHVPCA